MLNGAEITVSLERAAQATRAIEWLNFPYIIDEGTEESINTAEEFQSQLGSLIGAVEESHREILNILEN